MTTVSTAGDPGMEPRLPLSGQTSGFNMDTLLDTLPGAWRYWVSARTGRPGVSLL